MHAADASAQPPRKRVTIDEVARAAGVSKTTVSVVLNGGADDLGIRESTRMAVVDSASRLGYTPNYAARNLRRQRTNVLSLLVQDLANPCFVDIAVATRAAAVARGYEVNVIDAGPFDSEMRAIEHLRGGGADAVIVATGRHAARGPAIESLKDLVRHGRPVVMLIDRSPDPAIPAIRVDVEGGAYVATSHLVALGHRRIAHLALQGSNPIEAELTSQGDRYRGFRRALHDAGLPFEKRWLIRGSDTLAGGREMMRSLLELPGARPTAVLVYNDLTAIGALRALHDAGIRVPDDMALVGTDGIELGEYTTPPLTTVDHPREELGRLAIETVCGLLAGTRPADTERVLQARLIVRASCGGSPAANQSTKTWEGKHE